MYKLEMYARVFGLHRATVRKSVSSSGENAKLRQAVASLATNQGSRPRHRGQVRDLSFASWTHVRPRRMFVAEPLPQSAGGRCFVSWRVARVVQLLGLSLRCENVHKLNRRGHELRNECGIFCCGIAVV